MYKQCTLKTLVLFLILTVSAYAGAASGNQIARGCVFSDQNQNGVKDAEEPGIPKVAVSNGEQVVLTDNDGRYTLPVSNDTIIHVVKPRDWMTPVNTDQLPQFYYIHKPAGSPELEYSGVAPTGPLPESIDFPLYARPEPDRFKVVFFADPQPYRMQQVDYLARDVVEELIGADIAFGVTLGDIVGDRLDLFEPVNGVIGQIGRPWYNVIGNHDINQDVPDNTHSTESYQRVYGPTDYAFQYANVHFITFNSTYWQGEDYVGRITEQQARFIRNYLEHVPKDHLVVLMMHISLVHDDKNPGNLIENPEILYPILQDFPHTFSLSGHWHNQAHYFIDRSQGWMQDTPHHHLVQVTAGGSWWGGHVDEFNIPHATMDDGRPNGYTVFTFDDNDYSFRFKAARRPADYQMNIYAPDEVAIEALETTEVIANVFSGSERSDVRMRLPGHSDWVTMERYIGEDPNYVRLLTLNDRVPEYLGNNLNDFYDYSEWESLYSLWRAPIPASLDAGIYHIEVESTDMFGQVDTGRRVLRVVETAE